MVAHVSVECVNWYRWPPGSGTCWDVFTKAVCACGTLRNTRERAALSSETKNGEGSLLLCFVVSTRNDILGIDLGIWGAVTSLGTKGECQKQREYTNKSRKVWTVHL